MKIEVYVSGIRKFAHGLVNGSRRARCFIEPHHITLLKLSPILILDIHHFLGYVDYQQDLVLLPGKFSISKPNSVVLRYPAKKSRGRARENSLELTKVGQVTQRLLFNRRSEVLETEVLPDNTIVDLQGSGTSLPHLSGWKSCAWRW